ncbi:AI-2E family transporter [uncultured Flavonifractor sp.]|uniref:AI-2E family transporter n=1 Tax=uncultured Flavonifractor sp. TaxID=1193534 RepID=UPI002632EC57|nr:AI-2E family transporter [uncultured Flavonifractor sp.]
MDKRLFKSILLIITYAVVLVMVLARLELIGAALGQLLGLFRPLIIGFALAFILNRPCHFFFRLYSRGLGKTKAAGAARPLAVVSSYLALIVVIAAVFSFVVPKLTQSIQTFALNLSGYLTNIQDWVNQLVDYLHLDMEALDLSRLNETLENLFQQTLGMLSSLAPHLLELTTGIVSVVVTGVLALVFSIYMLSGRERLLAQCRRVLRAYVPAKFADPITDVVHLTSDTFTKFITGQLIEACILGGLCSAGMLFIQPDYAPLIGVTIGASAIIPVAGAYIGAIISAVLLLMVSPLKALVFLLFLVVLQQIEGNVIYPKVVGSSIGLPGIWVLAAVTVGGGLLGLEGVLLSVPVASVLYTLLRRDVRKRLTGKRDV